MTTLVVTGVDAALRRLKSHAANLRATSATGVEVVPAAADMPKAEALVRDGRDIFAVDAALEQSLAAVGQTAVDEMIARVEAGGTGSPATVLTKIGDRALEAVRARIDDVEPTPGGKTPLKRPRADGSTDHIGKDKGNLYRGLVRRLTSGGGR